MIALLALCTGILPIPLTALFCFPPGALLGIVSLVLGLMALREIRVNGDSGKTLAFIAIIVGGLVILGMICMLATGAILLPRVYEWIVQVIHQPRP